MAKIYVISYNNIVNMVFLDLFCNHNHAGFLLSAGLFNSLLRVLGSSLLHSGPVYFNEDFAVTVLTRPFLRNLTPKVFRLRVSRMSFFFGGVKFQKSGELSRVTAKSLPLVHRGRPGIFLRICSIPLHARSTQRQE